MEMKHRTLRRNRSRGHRPHRVKAKVAAQKPVVANAFAKRQRQQRQRKRQRQPKLLNPLPQDLKTKNDIRRRIVVHKRTALRLVESGALFCVRGDVLGSSASASPQDSKRVRKR